MIYVIYKREKVNYMNNKNALTFMKVKEGIKVNWAQILFNNLCSEVNRWTNMQEKMQASESMKKKKIISFSTGFGKIL